MGNVCMCVRARHTVRGCVCVRARARGREAVCLRVYVNTVYHETLTSISNFNGRLRMKKKNPKYISYVDLYDYF